VPFSFPDSPMSPCSTSRKLPSVYFVDNIMAAPLLSFAKTEVEAQFSPAAMSLFVLQRAHFIVNLNTHSAIMKNLVFPTRPFSLKSLAVRQISIDIIDIRTAIFDMLVHFIYILSCNTEGAQLTIMQHLLSSLD
jgi:hypothetical protein